QSRAASSPSSADRCSRRSPPTSGTSHPACCAARCPSVRPPCRRRSAGCADARRRRFRTVPPRPPEYSPFAQLSCLPPVPDQRLTKPSERRERGTQVTEIHVVIGRPPEEVTP